MAHKSTFEVKFRRRREEKTDYKKRLALVRSKKLRIVVRKTNKRIIAQLVKFDKKGDITITTADSGELKKYGWYGTNNTPSAYLTGFLLGKKAGKEQCVLDIGRKHPSHGSGVFATLKGASDAGLQAPFNPEALPSEERINGKTLDAYTVKLGEKAKIIFANYIKEGMTLGSFNKAFEKAKAEIAKVKA
ncbi:MAG: 50S ribosomal protein L18 [Candidatus Diapherotrites archaeon]|nr:50S ribosomal protein L18 [Candidatus Diapherotrites archaeon]